MDGNMLDRAVREGVNNFIGGLLIGLCVGGVITVLLAFCGMLIAKIF
jgi:hypothetical protein